MPILAGTQTSISLVSKNKFPNLILNCCPNVLSNKLKNHKINSCVQICNPTKIDALMNKAN